jgi:hypothetical protein
MKLVIEIDVEAAGGTGYGLESVLNHLAYRMPRDLGIAIAEGEEGVVFKGRVDVSALELELGSTQPNPARVGTFRFTNDGR